MNTVTAPSNQQRVLIVTNGADVVTGGPEGVRDTVGRFNEDVSRGGR
jgi:hypothetical protein